MRIVIRTRLLDRLDLRYTFPIRTRLHTAQLTLWVKCYYTCQKQISRLHGADVLGLSAYSGETCMLLCGTPFTP